METWAVILIVVLVGAVVYFASRPPRTVGVWYDSLPLFYDRLPIFGHRGGSWSGRGGGHSGWGGSGHHGDGRRGGFHH